MDLHKLKAFYQAANSKSFSKTNLTLSSSVVSRHVSDLEKFFDLKLFFRTPEGLKLTCAGKDLYERTEKILYDLKTLEQSLSNYHENPIENLDVIIPTNWASTFLISYISSFIEAYPNINLNIITDDKTPDFDQTSENKVAILPYAPKESKLVRRFLMSFHLKLYASEDYLAKKGCPQNLSQLDHHQLISSSGRDKWFEDIDWHLMLGKKSHENKRKPFIKVNNAFYCAEAGLGIATLASENTLLKNSNLKEVLPHVQGPTINAFLVYPEHLRLSKPVKIFSDFIFSLTEKLDS